MPHDKFRQLIEVGDVVYIPAKVTMITAGEEYCNLTLETLELMFPGEHKTMITLNGKQVIKERA